MTDILTPPHAAKVWANNDILFVELPNPDGEKSHLLRLPLNIWGLTQMLNTLKARNPRSKIGDKGDPTQFQADAQIKDMQKKAASYTGKVTKPKPKIPLTTALQGAVRDAMRKAGII